MRRWSSQLGIFNEKSRLCAVLKRLGSFLITSTGYNQVTELNTRPSLIRQCSIEHVLQIEPLRAVV